MPVALAAQAGTGCGWQQTLVLDDCFGAELEGRGHWAAEAGGTRAKDALRHDLERSEAKAIERGSFWVMTAH